MKNGLLGLIGEKPVETCTICRLYSTAFALIMRLVGAIVRSLGLLGGAKGEGTQTLLSPLPPHYPVESKRLKIAALRGVTSFLIGIANFGFLVPMVTGSPITVIWSFTNMCNLRCVHCCEDSGKAASNELSVEECFRFIDTLAEADVTSISFSGGEPLMRRDFFEIAHYAFEKDLVLSLATNGMLLTKSVAKKLKESGIRYVEVSIDSASSEKHDLYRGVSGSFDKAIQAIQNCVDLEVPVGIAFTITKQNVSEIDAVLRLGRELKVNQVVFLNFLTVGRGDRSRDLELSPLEMDETLSRIVDCRAQGRDPFKVVVLNAPPVARIIDRKKLTLDQIGFTRIEVKGREVLLNLIGGCGAGRTMAAVNHSGDIRPCPFIHIKLGNIRSDNFIDVWRTHPILTYMRDRKNLRGQCNNCEYKVVCGGCRARAYLKYGDLMAPDPLCTL